MTSWRTLTPSSILARSGQRILLSGLGFRPSGTGYTCVLLHPPGNTSVPATALSATAMECIFPLWDRSAASAPLLLLDGAASVIFAGGGSPAVEVVAGWDMVMTTGDSAAGVMDEEVQRVRASGGAVIAVRLAFLPFFLSFFLFSFLPSLHSSTLPPCHARRKSCSCFARCCN